MSDWMRTDYLFDDHRALFTLTCKCGMGKAIFQYMRSAAMPSELASAVTEIVVKARPELAGCVVYYLRYDPACHCWEIAVSHSSLPAVPLACEVMRIPLEPVEC